MTPDLRDLLHVQGRAWIARTADLERWSDLHEDAEQAILQACPDASLAKHVEDLRERMRAAMKRAGCLPRHERVPCHPPPAPEADPHEQKPRGLARHLYPKGKP